MIQRVQTLYLLAVAALMTVMIFADLATVTMAPPPGGEPQSTVTTAADGTITSVTRTVATDSITFDIWSISQNGQEVIPTTYMAVLMMLTLALALVTILLYRYRWVQIRLCFAMAVMLLGAEGFIAMYIYKLRGILDAMSQYAIKYSVFDLVPIAALICVYFAFRGISRDEALVRSLDRIR